MPVTNPSTGTPDVGAAPAVSVIVPVHRAVATIGATLESLAAQSLPADQFEVLLVFNGPDDGGRALVEQWAAEHPDVQLRLLDCDQASAGAARNVALDALRGVNVTFLDADDWVSPNFLAELVAAADGTCIPVAGLVDVDASGTINDQTTVMQSLAGNPTRMPVFSSTPVTGMMAVKLFPAAMLESVRFQPELRSGEDVVFNSDVFEPFHLNYTPLDSTPWQNGALYYRRLSETSVSRQQESYDFLVSQRLAGIRAMLRGKQASVDERTPLTRRLVAAQLGFVERYLAKHPEDRRRAQAEAVGLEGVRLVDEHHDRIWPDYDSAVGLGRAKQPVKEVSLISATTSQLNRRAKEVAMIRAAGVKVRAAYFSGAYDAKLMPIPRHRMVVVPPLEPVDKTAPRPTGLLAKASNRGQRYLRHANKLARFAAPHLIPNAALPAVLARTDKEASEFLEGSLPISLGSQGEALATSRGLDGQPSQVLAALTLAAASTQSPVPRHNASVIRRSARAAQELPESSPFRPPAPVWSMVIWRLVKSTRLAAADEVLEIARELFADSLVEDGFELLGMLSQMAQTPGLPEGWEQATTAAMQAADRALDNDDVARAVWLANLVCEVLFHNDVQTNVAEPPLVIDPDRLLAPLQGSRVWTLLTTPRQRQADSGRNAGEHRPSVLVIPGSFPKFADGVVASVDDAADVEVLPLQEISSALGTRGVGPEEIAARLQVALGEPQTVRPDLEEILRARDVVFTDWVDRGAVMTSLMAEPQTRLVVRFHGVDSLSMWQFLMDWSRVDDVVFVSEHLQASVNALIGAQLEGVRQHVIGNTVDFDRFPAESSEQAPRTLALVGWAQKVKDPLWAVEVLALLRQTDPTWRLKLIGADMPKNARRASEDAYADAFRERVLRDDVSEAIEYVGFTKDLPRHLRDVGFALSTSLRESWHIGVLEMVAAQAVPVIRNWPVYARYGGARKLYGDWVVDTPEQAAERILAHSDPQVWRQAADAARDEVKRRFSEDRTGDLYRELLLGRRYSS